MIVWTDIETTGLFENVGKILEIAMVITDDSLNEISFKEMVLSGQSQLHVPMDPVVLEMHTKNGLIQAVGERGTVTGVFSNPISNPISDDENSFIRWLFSQFPVSDYRKVPLAGSTVGFDRRWLRYHMPRLEGMFSHRSIDVSSVTELAQRWAPTLYETRPKSTDTHRALADVRGSIEILKHFVNGGFLVKEEPKIPVVVTEYGSFDKSVHLLTSESTNG